MLATVVNHLHEAQSRYQNYEQKLRSVEEDIQRKTSLYDVKLGEVEKCMKGIEEKFGPRPSKLGDVDKIKNEIKQIRMVLDTREQV